MSKRRQNGLRLMVAQEAARLMAEQGIRNFHTAKRKAAERLGANDRTSLPGNAEIETALGEHHRLFQADEHPGRLRDKREIACRTMRMLVTFSPRLVGPVLAGTATADGEVNLHVFAETPEEVAFDLMRLNVPFESAERRLRLPAGAYATFPVFRFFAGDQQVDLTVFARREASRPPLSPVDGKPMRRVSLEDVEALLEG